MPGKPRVAPDEVKGHIEQALIRSAEIDAERIQIHVDSDTVLITGAVRSWAEREAAEQSVWRAPAVTNVINQIEVWPR